MAALGEMNKVTVVLHETARAATCLYSTPTSFVVRLYCRSVPSSKTCTFHLRIAVVVPYVSHALAKSLASCHVAMSNKLKPLCKNLNLSDLNFRFRCHLEFLLCLSLSTFPRKQHGQIKKLCIGQISELY